MPFLALIAAGAALPALAATLELAASPLATSSTTVVKPNLMFVLDDSGSMDWDYMPDTVKNFSGSYGFNSSQCNGTYYNPAINYTPPVNSTRGPLNVTPATFSAAYKDGYSTAAGTVNLSTGFTGGSGSGASGINLTPGPAFYYTYSGTQTSAAQKDYNNSNSVFYKECDSNIGSTTKVDGTNAVNTVFTKFRLAATPTTTITIAGAGGAGATITVATISKTSDVSSVKVNGAELLRSFAGSSRSASTLANNIANAINACTSGSSGGCTVSGYSATVSGKVVTVVGPAAAAGYSPVVTRSSGDATFTTTVFPSATATTVSSIRVNGVALMSASATGTTTTDLASDIRSKITQGGFSATVSNNIVTITGPVTASNYTPVITVTSGSMTLTTEAFPESDPVKLQNFTNWYSYFSNRMLMMKTATGQAFALVTDKHRVGFMTMNNNVSPGIVEVAPFDAGQKSAWYSKLYASNPANNTPLREALSRVGQYYAHKFGAVTTYTATITVGGSGATTVDSMTVKSVETMVDTSAASTSTNTVAANIANQINAMQVTDYGAKVSGSVITITGPASAAGSAPVVSNDGGGMTFATTAFAGTTTTATLNGISPADPVEYSCQQNFTILSTDGYWNGATTYNIAGGTVGQQDGSAARPMYDGAQASTTYSFTYTRDSYSKVTSGCSGGNKKLQTQPQIGTCVKSVSTGSCTPANWSSNGSATLGSTCNSVAAPPPSAAFLQTGSPVQTFGTLGGTSDTLADVAMYYYQTDLRTSALANCTGALGNSVCENNVFIAGNDNNIQQHMTTFTLGLGTRGRMIYAPSYLSDSTGDYVAVKLGSTASSTVCTWQATGTTCNWPTPSSGAIENVDDLWHAAINGRGAYFSATDPLSLANGLSNALTTISSKEGSAAAAATSTLNPVAGNNVAYVASYTTLKWEGNLEARAINTDTGKISENASWCVENVAASSCAAPASIVADSSGDATAYYCSTPNAVICTAGELVGTDCRVPVATACVGTMNASVSTGSDTRKIYTAKSDGAALIPFDSAYRAANPGYFDAARLSALSQWPPASDTSVAANAYRAAAPGDNLVKYLRGQYGHEYERTSVAVTDQLYRNRATVLGDALESQPAFLAAPVFSYPYSGYTEFVIAQASRGGTVYMGANDGMLHAFAADTGIERWAYVPSIVIPNMWRLADKQYSEAHYNFVNGSPTTSEICTANCNNAYSVSTPGSNPVWKTILVAGLNGGGRGYYALDITDPSVPVLLWEFTTSAGIGKVKDNDLGYSYGQPVITRKADGTWVVLLTSGYDNGADGPVKSGGTFIANSPAGSGNGYLYVLNAGTGTIISKIATGTVGTAAAPSGLAKIAGYNFEPVGNVASHVYGGDLLGNLWRFDINIGTTAAIGTGTALKFATLFSDTAGTNPQPITSTPLLGNILGKRVVFIGTGKYLETADLSTTQLQTQYAIKDDDASTTLVNPRTTLVQQILSSNPNGTASRLASTNLVDFSTGRGWFVNFPDAGERVNIDANLVLGTLVVPSIVPSSTACSPGGTGWLNFFDYRTGSAVVLNSGLGIVSSKYDSTIVGVNIIYIQGQPRVEVVTSSNPTPELDPNVLFKAAGVGFAGKRVTWRELIP